MLETHKINSCKNQMFVVTLQSLVPGSLVWNAPKQRSCSETEHLVQIFIVMLQILFVQMVKKWSDFCNFIIGI